MSTCLQNCIHAYTYNIKIRVSTTTFYINFIKVDDHKLTLWYKFDINLFWYKFLHYDINLLLSIIFLNFYNSSFFNMFINVLKKLSNF